MKKVLMGTTALVMASVALANVASAEVSISGSVSYFLTYKSGSLNTELGNSVYPASGKQDEYKVNLDIEQLDWQTEVVVSGGGVTDAGLNYGAEAQIRTGVDLSSTSTGDVPVGASGDESRSVTLTGSGDFVTTDEVFVHVGGDSWGKITIGNDDDALDRTQVHAGSVAVGLGHQWNTTFNKTGGNSDDAKVVYETPSFSGFNAALSLAPTKGSAENAIAAGANFSQDLGGMSFKVGGGIRMQSVLNRTGAAEKGIEDGGTKVSDFGYQAGVSGTFDAFSVSLGYGSGTETTKKTTDTSADTDKAINYLGGTVAYNFGQGGVSLSYLLGLKDKTGGATEKKGGSSIVIDADYKLADGLVAQFEGVLNSADPNGGDVATPAGGADPSSTIVGFGLVANF